MFCGIESVWYITEVDLYQIIRLLYILSRHRGTIHNKDS